ncbi:MAG TPA: glycosyltransferase [Candidatus Nanoarchaeia archaeon]|nr:glycosyltransferase [Candidatus Nanoarchaeia archaeon]
MIPALNNYIGIAGKKAVDRIRQKAEYLAGKRVVHISSTSAGGGVAEILNTLVFLMCDLGIDTEWRILLGSHSFFKITKGIHNALQGKNWEMTPSRRRVYLEFCKRNSMINHINDNDIVIIHDPQPIGMIEEYRKKTTWLWRCHIDISKPNIGTMKFLLPYIRRFDGMIVSSPKFKIKYLRNPQFIIHPSIDPLSQKNLKISKSKARSILSKRGIDTDKKIISQVSRFDPWKDHFGVIRMYEKIKEKEDCQLVLMGDMAGDDPQGSTIYYKVKQKCDELKDVHLITEKNDLLVNALQQESAFVFQNSIKEGFALTVSEALWKKTPVIGTPVGGIPLQIINNKTGFLIRSQAEGVKRGLQLLQDCRLRSRLGSQGHEHVKNNFLITRHLEDYIDLFNRFYPQPKFWKGVSLLKGIKLINPVSSRHRHA